jgi:hypothetical protein
VDRVPKARSAAYALAQAPSKHLIAVGSSPRRAGPWAAWAPWEPASAASAVPSRRPSVRVQPADLGPDGSHRAPVLGAASFGSHTGTSRHHPRPSGRRTVTQGWPHQLGCERAAVRATPEMAAVAR